VANINNCYRIFYFNITFNWWYFIITRYFYNYSFCSVSNTFILVIRVHNLPAAILPPCFLTNTGKALATWNDLSIQNCCCLYRGRQKADIWFMFFTPNIYEKQSFKNCKVVLNETDKRNDITYKDDQHSIFKSGCVSGLYSITLATSMRGRKLKLKM
jgi:hypothetical protein